MRRKTDLKKNKVFYKVNYRNRKLYKKIGLKNYRIGGNN